MIYQGRFYTTIYIVHNTTVHNIGGSSLHTSGMIKNHMIHGHKRDGITKVISHNLNFAYFEHYILE